MEQPTGGEAEGNVCLVRRRRSIFSPRYGTYTHPFPPVVERLCCGRKIFTGVSRQDLIAFFYGGHLIGVRSTLRHSTAVRTTAAYCCATKLYGCFVTGREPVEFRFP